MKKDAQTSQSSPRLLAAAALVAADVMTLAARFPEYGEDVIMALYRALSAESGRAPTRDEARRRLEDYAAAGIAGPRLERALLGGGEAETNPAIASDPLASGAPPVARSRGRRGGRPPGTTTTITGDDDYRERWSAYLRWCGRDRRPTLTGFATWTGDDGRHWPLSTINDFRRMARERGVELPPRGREPPG